MREMLPVKSLRSARLLDGFYCSRCQWQQRFSEPKPIVGDDEATAARAAFDQHVCNDWGKREVKHFQLEHPPEVTVLCDDFTCKNVADYLELDEYGHEHCWCALHTSSGRHAAVLTRREPDRELRYRSRSAA